MKRLLVFFVPLLLLACNRSKGPEPASVAGAFPPGRVWQIRDNGKRCVAAPCPSWTVTDWVTKASRDITDVDLTGMKFSPEVEKQMREQLFHGRMVALGDIVTVPKAGPAGDATVLKVDGVRMLNPGL